MIADPFADPTPYVASGLQPARCDRCGRPGVYVDAQYRGAVMCGECWRAHHSAPAGIAKTSAPSVAWPRSLNSSESILKPPATQATQATQPTHRVLISSREPYPDAVTPPHAASLATLAGRNGWTVTTTHALAETLASGELTRSCVVRIARKGGRPMVGYGAWHNDRYAGGVWMSGMSPRKLGLAELQLVVSGQPLPPPKQAITGPCPRCWRQVRWTRTGKPYAHKDLHTKLACD